MSVCHPDCPVNIEYRIPSVVAPRQSSAVSVIYLGLVSETLTTNYMISGELAEN